MVSVPVGTPNQAEKGEKKLRRTVRAVKIEASLARIIRERGSRTMRAEWKRVGWPPRVDQTTVVRRDTAQYAPTTLRHPTAGGIGH